MPQSKSVTRVGDMHPTRAVKIYEQDDGDITVYITQDGYPVGEADSGNESARSAVVEFSVSGGRSQHTLQALRALAEAMRQDEAARLIE